jgi:hypothetical protein
VSLSELEVLDFVPLPVSGVISQLLGPVICPVEGRRKVRVCWSTFLLIAVALMSFRMQITEKNYHGSCRNQDIV